MLTAEGLYFAYGRRPAVRDVSFDVSPGEIVGVVGANGAGKSTLLKLLAGVLVPSKGKVVLDGLDCYRNSLEYRKHIAFLPESCPVYGDMTPTDYLRYRARLKRERWLRLRRRLREASDRLDLDAFADRPMRELSLGCRKRVAIADALLLSPQAVFLDDPLAGVDPVTQKRIGSALTDLSTNAAIVLSGHALEMMKTFCTRFAVLHEGRLAAMLNVRDFQPAELTAKLIELSSGAGKGAA